MFICLFVDLIYLWANAGFWIYFNIFWINAGKKDKRGHWCGGMTNVWGWVNGGLSDGYTKN